MRAQIIGRTLGIGLRVVGRMAGEKIAAGAATAQPAAPAAQRPPATPYAETGRAAAQTVKGAARGAGGFLRPFRRVGGILWLEVTGSFFLLFALVFGQSLWRLRANYPQGPAMHQFWVSAAATALFLYLGLSSFWRARKR